MTLLKESYLCHLLSLLLAAYQHSALHRLAEIGRAHVWGPGAAAR